MSVLDQLISESAAREIKQFGRVLEDPNRRKRGKNERPINYEQLRLNREADEKVKRDNDLAVAKHNEVKLAFEKYKDSATEEQKNKLRDKAAEIIAFINKEFSGSTSYSLSKNNAYLVSQIRLNWCEGISVPYEIVYRKFNKETKTNDETSNAPHKEGAE